jgi:hypothetical protein
MRRIISFGAASLGVIALALLAFWVRGGFRSLGLDAAGAVALVLGIVVTSALGAALMTLVFCGDRVNAGEIVYRVADEADDSHSTNRLENGGNHQ